MGSFAVDFGKGFAKGFAVAVGMDGGGGFRPVRLFGDGLVLTAYTI